MLGALPRQASGDPAMVSGFRMASILSRSITGTLPVSPSEPDCCWTFLLRRDPFGKLFPVV